MVVDRDERAGDDVTQDGEGLGSQVGVDGGLAGCVDGFDGGDGLFVGVGFGDGDELGEGDVVGCADEDRGHHRVEEVFEEALGELDCLWLLD